MEFKQLEAFVAVVDYGSFSEAARRLYLTQPTISAHIRSLEDELHMKLIIRTTKKTTITAKGYQLYDSAVRMLEIRNNLLHNIGICITVVIGNIEVYTLLIADFFQAAFQIVYDLVQRCVIYIIADTNLEILCHNR